MADLDKTQVEEGILPLPEGSGALDKTQVEEGVIPLPEDPNRTAMDLAEKSPAPPTGAAARTYMDFGDDPPAAPATGPVDRSAATYMDVDEEQLPQGPPRPSRTFMQIEDEESEPEPSGSRSVDIAPILSRLDHLENGARKQRQANEEVTEELDLVKLSADGAATTVREAQDEVNRLRQQMAERFDAESAKVRALEARVGSLKTALVVLGLALLLAIIGAGVVAYQQVTG